ncbi:MAG: porin family protein [Bacteroidales bacterium]|nr:porin family protein [Bacteroidales bacterium]
MKTKFYGSHFRAGTWVFLCLSWASAAVQAQTSDSAVFIRPQPAEIVHWAAYKPGRQLPRATLKLDAGYGWRTAPTSDQLTDDMKAYVEHLKSAFVWNASFDFFFNDRFGIRMTFYQYLASHSDQAYKINTGKSGTLATKDRITHIGPAFVFRLSFGRQKSWIFDANVGMGYIGYRENTTFADEYFKYSGASLGMQTGAGLEYRIAPQWSIGINMQLTSGEITELQYNDNGVKTTQTYDAGEGEGLGQISLGIGIRYHIK